MVVSAMNSHPVGLPCMKIGRARWQFSTSSSNLLNRAAHAESIKAAVLGVAPRNRMSSILFLQVKCKSDCCEPCDTGLQHDIGDPCACSTCSGVSGGTQSSASLTRAVGLLRPSTSLQVLRQIRNRPPSSPLSVFFFMITALVSVLAAARAAIIRRACACSRCKGFGIERCDLCFGAGVVDWEGKYSHVNEPCPKCFGARYNKCGGCGGLYCRPIFAHNRTKQYSVLRDILEFRPRGTSS